MEEQQVQENQRSKDNTIEDYESAKKLTLNF